MMIKAKPTIDDFLILAFLVLTIWHSAHVLAAYEIIGELAWPLAVGVDVGIARAAYVTGSRACVKGARWIAGGWLAFLLTASYGLNVSYYTDRGASTWALALASLFPVSLAAVGGIKAFLVPDANKQPESLLAVAQAATITKTETTTETVIDFEKLLEETKPARSSHLLTAYKNGELDDEGALAAGVKPSTLASWRTRYRRTQTVTIEQ